mmetsp:Transcript_8868/g.13726  ORF Transcript_8868/g.13726 Transcript_8868/m.13726 type:complete len:320 (+) Transcript_8868:312-1271(+)|eukprot:CAMPEP_0118687324 /NCGR_PEP_ID=MMETSP0800-20121206/8316_1 /TAXON_ID=210618 ORGANISM="Striatella unipunctata, Strain CCMP2910" /NCGR_SAMPLE_ID=MMETSP0800 /ASSEMBLY_ACC=CAM_ASM_000638 /LENGTH=319 /DNA_ID=CAMNT_0006584489 /DNA_START=399 /DNA_END=1358 /DNA_ORIENTATION=-
MSTSEEPPASAMSIQFLRTGTSLRDGAVAAPVSNIARAPSARAVLHRMRASEENGGSEVQTREIILRMMMSRRSFSARRPRVDMSPRPRSNSHDDGDAAADPVEASLSSPSSLSVAKARGRDAQRENDSMVYLDGPQVYTCAQCRTHLTSHDDIISKSFHGRHGRAYLFDQCVNVTIGPAEDRLLITGLHSVCDIFCKRCKGMVGWTYARAYETSQKYKEGKFIIEKINLHLEESDRFDVMHPAGERRDRWRIRSMSWGSDAPPSPRGNDIVYEYEPRGGRSTHATSPNHFPYGSPPSSATPPASVLDAARLPPSPPFL